VYVLNSKDGSPNITGFRLDVNGRLDWVATVDLPSGSAGANDIRFAPDGSELLVTIRQRIKFSCFRSQATEPLATRSRRPQRAAALSVSASATTSFPQFYRLARFGARTACLDISDLLV
jgi:hypothetical protein